jgi:hypothetical protein
VKETPTPEWWPFVRDVTLFVGGLVGVAVELIDRVAFGGTVDLGLLALFAGMMGLPYTLRKDEGK